MEIKVTTPVRMHQHAAHTPKQVGNGDMCALL